jgi:glutamate N-acetyltransferase/amino-acid N-acetyltransferase
MLSILSTQAMLEAVGIGAKRSLPVAATLNWVLKDGLGRMGRISVGALFGSGFDSDLKV